MQIETGNHTLKRIFLVQSQIFEKRVSLLFMQYSQSVTGSYEKLFLNISQTFQKSTCAGVSFNKLACIRPAALLKKETPTRDSNTGVFL